jgi:hypothetical protein
MQGNTQLLTMCIVHAANGTTAVALIRRCNSTVTVAYSESFVHSCMSGLCGVTLTAAFLKLLHTSHRYCIDSYTELTRGALATLRSFSGAHALTYELSWRDVLPRRHPTVPFAHAASLSVVSEARPSVKSSVKYTYTDDRRDHPFVPTGMSPYFYMFK